MKLKNVLFVLFRRLCAGYVALLRFVFLLMTFLIFDRLFIAESYGGFQILFVRMLLFFIVVAAQHCFLKCVVRVMEL